MTTEEQRQCAADVYDLVFTFLDNYPGISSMFAGFLATTCEQAVTEEMQAREDEISEQMDTEDA